MIAVDPDSVEAVDRVPHGGASGDVLDFSANTNPRTPDGVADAHADALEASRRYPDDGYPAFRAAAADHVDVGGTAAEGTTSNDADAADGASTGEVSAGQVVPAPGGLAAIRLAIATTVRPGDPVLVPAPSFGEYAREVRLQGGEPRFRAHDRLLDTDDAALEDAALAVVCNPNNPTGDAYDADALRAFADRCRAAGTTLLADEAFLGFTDRPSLAGRKGVVVARSLTKLFGLPGIRAGFAVATGDAYDRLATARRAWNLSTPAAAVGAVCMRDREFVRGTRERIAAERRRLREELGGPFDVYHPDDDRCSAGAVEPATAPFLLLEVGDRDVTALCERARKRGVALRDATTFRGLDAHVRVAVKDRAANDRLLEVLCDA